MWKGLGTSCPHCHGYMSLLLHTGTFSSFWSQFTHHASKRGFLWCRIFSDLPLMLCENSWFVLLAFSITCSYCVYIFMYSKSVFLTQWKCKLYEDRDYNLPQPVYSVPVVINNYLGVHRKGREGENQAVTGLGANLGLPQTWQRRDTETLSAGLYLWLCLWWGGLDRGKGRLVPQATEGEWTWWGTLTCHYNCGQAPAYHIILLPA